MAHLPVPLGDVKDYAGITSDSKDDVVYALIEGTLAWLERRTGRRLNGVGPVAKLRSGNGNQVLWLPDDPISITSVEERDDAELTDFTTFLATDYYLEGRRLIRLNDATPSTTAGKVWPRGFNNLRTTNEAGYTSKTMPSDLALVVKAVVGVLYEGSSQAGIKREKIGRYEIEYFEGGAQIATAGGVPVEAIIGMWMTSVIPLGIAV